MNENAKKVAIIVVAVLAVGLAVFEGMNTLGGPKEVKKEIGHGTPGHGMKAAENAADAAPPGGAPPKEAADPLAGP